MELSRVREMNNRSAFFTAMLSLLVLAGPMQALEWNTMLISTKPEHGADVVRTKFEFKNTSKIAVHILGVTTSCGCTEATPSTSEVKPGESGAIDVLFTIGQRTGLQEKDITLLTDDSKVPVRLKLKIALPEAGAKDPSPTK
jgi:hypothetical protein